MELKDEDKIVISQLKEKMRQISDEIYNIHTNPQNKIEILKRMSQIMNILSTISNYSDPKPDLQRLKNKICDIEVMFEQDGNEYLVQNQIRSFCVSANSITLNFPKEKMSFFTKIKNLTLFRTILKIGIFLI